MRNLDRLGRRWELALILITAVGCSKPPSVSAPPAAEKPKAESDLAMTTLSSEGVGSLGIRSETVPLKEVQDRLQLTGWIMARQGNEVTVTAPVAGYVRAPAGAMGNSTSTPVNGLPAQQGQELFSLAPVLSPVEQIQMAALKRGFENELEKAKESVAVADADLKRIKSLFEKGGLRTEQDVQQAEKTLKHAQQDLAAAQDKLKLFGSSVGPEATLKTMPIRAPRSGTVVTVHVSPGQYVAAAAPLVTIVDLSSPWVRVPVPENDLLRVNVREPVVVALRQNGTANGEHWLEGRPVAAVPQVDPVRHTADLVYELALLSHKVTASAAALAVTQLAAADNSWLFLPGMLHETSRLPALAKDQMVTVYVPLGAKRRQCIMPYSAVVFDAYGGAWIYVDKTGTAAGKHVYERRRVELGPAVKEGIVVHPAIASTEKVVVEGAAALFSREFHKPPVGAGAAKTEIDDDD